VSPTPLSRGYLYLRRNAFFYDSVDFSVGSDGMLSNSDTSSTQEITAILTELAETAAPFVTGAPGFNAALKVLEKKLSDDDKKTIDQLKKNKPQDAADFLNKLSTANLTNLLKEMAPEDLAVVLEKLPSTDLGVLLKKLAPADLAIVVGKLPSADAFGVLDKLSQADLGEILKKWPPAELSALAKNLTLRKLNELPQELTPADKNAVSATFAAIFATINTQTVKDEQEKLESQKRPVCFKAVSDLVNMAPFYDTVSFEGITDNTINGSVPDSKAIINLVRGPSGSIARGSTITWTIPLIAADKNHDGVSIRFASEDAYQFI
jgi:hypothetical protein